MGAMSDMVMIVPQINRASYKQLGSYFKTYIVNVIVNIVRNFIYISFIISYIVKH